MSQASALFIFFFCPSSLLFQRRPGLSILPSIVFPDATRRWVRFFLWFPWLQGTGCWLLNTILCSPMLLWSAGTSSSPEDSPEPAPFSSPSDTSSSSAFPCTATCRITAVTLSSLPSRCPSTLSISLIVSQTSWRSFASTLHWPWAPSSGLCSCLSCSCSFWMHSVQPPLRCSLFLWNFLFLFYSFLFDRLGLPSAWLPSFPPSWPWWVLLCRSSGRSP